MKDKLIYRLNKEKKKYQEIAKTAQERMLNTPEGSLSISPAGNYHSFYWCIKDKKLKKVMYIYLDKIMGVTSALLLVAGTDEALQKKKEIWQYLKKKSLPMYLKLRTTPMGLSLNIPGRPGRKISVRGYKIARKLVGFN